MIRIAEKKDIPAILAIYAPYVEHTTISFEYTVPTLEEFTARFEAITKQYPWLVWEENGEILGYCYASAAYTRAAYAWTCEPSIYLREDVRGRGMGRRFYEALEKILVYQGYQLSFALITQENKASLSFHEAMGYKIKVFYEDIGFKHGRWLGLAWMEKRLKSVEIPANPPMSWEDIMQDEQRKSYILGILSLS